MTRLRGRSPHGEQLIDTSLHGHWKAAILIAVLGVEGVRCSGVVDGAMNGAIVEAFVDQVLAPELQPGDVVIMDNLSIHTRRRTRKLIEAAGAKLAFFPAYGPDLNPIEMIFSKIKQLLRTLGCRTRDTLWNSMQSVPDQVSAADAATCFAHCSCPLRLN